MIELTGYKNLKLVHEGHINVIYSALDANSHPVIIKTLRSVNPQPSEIALLYHEYEVTKNLELPGIIKTHHLITEKNRYALVQEDINGVSLSEYLKQRPVRELATFFTIAFQMIAVIEDVHHVQIIHKDIKPANFIIVPNTLNIKLTDFNYAAKLIHEVQEVVPPEKLEGTLFYMAPEQTGRMNMNIDYRSDFYALGVTFYELLTGSLPFPSLDPLEVVHDHLATMPPNAAEQIEFIPEMLGKLIQKLMAKDPTDRYQSTIGIKADLERISKNESDSFLLGEQDIYDHLNLSQKLYGREVEAKVLLKTYERVSQGAVEVLMVAGYSGIGKSKLINEVHKPMVEHKGYFISGKFDQLQKNTPYTAITQAFNQLAKHIMAEPEERFEKIKKSISEAMGDVGQIMIDLAHDFERILGPQKPLAKLPSKETQNRMMIFFRRFMEAVATKDHPLVIFIDDLQWSDSGSLKLLEYIITDDLLQYVLLIGAYRDNEVDDLHPLRGFLNQMSSQKNIESLSLKPLTTDHYASLFHDSFNRDIASVQPLAKLVHKRTEGNPFFCKQVITTIYQQKLLYFDYQKRQWEWDLQSINELNITDNVVDLMISKFSELPEQTQVLLKLAACAGNRFTIDILMVISDLSPEEIGKALWPAMQMELLFTLSLGYKRVDAMSQAGLGSLLSKEITYQFIHDRVQQAVYQSITQEEKQRTHLSIARSIVEKDPEGSKKKRLFEIADHYNEAHQLLNPHERIKVADLNYEAGMIALNANAYHPMLNYLNAGLSLCEENWWEDHYELIFNLNRGYVQSLYLTGQASLAVSLAEELLIRAKSTLDKVSIYRIQCVHLLSEGKLTTALEVGIKAIELLDVKIVQTPSRFTRFQKIVEIKWLMRNYHLGTMEKELNVLTDAKIIAVFEILSEIIYLSFFLPGEMNLGVSLEAMLLMLKYGSPPSAGLWVTMYAFTTLNYSKNTDQTFALLDLAERFIEQKNNKYTSGIAYNYAAYWMYHIKHPFEYCSHYYQLAIRNALESGNLLSAGIAMGCEVTSLWCRGKSCSQLLHSMEKSLVYFKKTHMKDNIDRSRFRIAIAQSYMSGLVGDDELIKLYSEIMQGTNLYYQKMAAAHLATYFYYTNRFEKAYQYHCIWYVEEKKMHYDGATFYQKTIDALTISKLITGSSGKIKKTYWKKYRQFYKDLEWAALEGPENYLHHYLILDGTLEMLHGNYIKAQRSFDKAIENAKKGEYFLWLGTACELAGEMLYKEGLHYSATEYIREAHYYYGVYGMKLKEKYLESQYPGCLAYRSSTQKSSVGEGSEAINSLTFSSTLDFMTIIKASQTISSEIVLEKLLEKMLQIAIESAGAEKAIFLEQYKKHWMVTASMDSSGFHTHKIPFKDFSFIAQSIIQFALRAEETVIVNDARTESKFKDDTYIKSKQTKSVLCVPIIHQSQLIGLLYLENNLTVGSFTEDRVKVLKTLASQIAISLVNSHHLERMQLLYKKTERFVPKRFLQLLEKESIEEVELGDSKQIDVAVMFADIRNFTTLSEKLGPKRLSQLINNYLGYMAPIIRKQSGFVEHFLGDGILALFPRTAEDAIIAALEMQEALSTFNADIQSSGFEPIQVGIGLNYGPVMLSILGEAERLDANVLSDVINVTSRIENLNKFYKTMLLIGEAIYTQISHPEKYLIRKVDNVYLKGKTVGQNIYEVMSISKQGQLETEQFYIAKFAEAFTLYESGDFLKAGSAFKGCLEIKPTDTVADLLLARCIDFQNRGTPKDWTGTLTMFEK